MAFCLNETATQALEPSVLVSKGSLGMLAPLKFKKSIILYKKKTISGFGINSPLTN